MLKVTELWTRQYIKLLSLCKTFQANTDCEEKFIHIMGLTFVLVIFIMHIVKLCFCSPSNWGQNSVCVIRGACPSFFPLVLPTWKYSLNEQVCLTVTYCVCVWEVPSLSASQNTGIMTEDFGCFTLSLPPNARLISQAMILSFQHLFISPLHTTYS